MKLTLAILVFIICFFFLANTTIQFKPFKIQLNNWLMAVGYVCIFVGIGLIRYDSERKATKETIIKVQEAIDKLIK